MTDRTYNVLFLSNGNSARSLLAEAILNRLCNQGGRFRGFSAGCQPGGHPHPMALDVLKVLRIPAAGLRCKSWDEFARHGAPEPDLVFTISDDSAGERRPEWPHRSPTSHWNIANPAAAGGSEELRRKAFLDAFTALRRRVELFTNLPVAALEQLMQAEPVTENGE